MVAFPAIRPVIDMIIYVSFRSVLLGEPFPASDSRTEDVSVAKTRPDRTSLLI